MTVEPKADRFFLFNFFERTDKPDALVKKWEDAALYMKNIDHFISTFLHESTDPESVYPFVNFVVTDSDDVCCYGKPDEQWLELTFKRFVGQFKGYPAGYREIASYSGSELQSENKDRSNDHRFLLTSMKVKDDVSADDLEANWKSWSGCDVIHEKLKGDSRLVESHLYKRFTTKLAPIFNYVVRTELTGLDDETGRKIAKTANERTAKQSGVETQTAFYNVRITHFHA